MGSRAGHATYGLFTVFCLVANGQAHAGVCSAYEDGERASHRMLTLADFAGSLPQENARAHDRNATEILIVTSIRIDELGVQTEPSGAGGFVARPSSLCVRAYLLKEQSGRRRQAKDGWDLRHEQGHFDLTELRARRLEARLAALEFVAETERDAEEGLRDLAARLYHDVLAEVQKAQDVYDRETRHGHNRLAQGRWLGELSSQLTPEPRRAVARARPDEEPTNR